MERALNDKDNSPPFRGWLFALRSALGLSRAAVAERLGLSASGIHNFEKSDAMGSISVKNLRRIAACMDCEVVIKIVPREGKTFRDLAAKNSRELSHLLATEHSMALEAQGTEPAEDLKRRHFGQ